MREFDTGATRNSNDNKLDHDGFNAPVCDRSYAQYMHKHRLQADGTLRASDNWRAGIPQEVYRKSMYRHMQDLRMVLDGYEVFDPDSGEHVEAEELLNAIEFNVKGLKYERINGGAE